MPALGKLLAKTRGPGRNTAALATARYAGTAARRFTVSWRAMSFVRVGMAGAVRVSGSALAVSTRPRAPSGDTDRVPPILVTGSHRSGTGWVGQVLAASPQPLGYVWEPFSILHRPGTCAARFEHWFPYVCAENEADVRGPVAAMLAWRYAYGAELAALRRPKDAARMARDACRFARNRRAGAVPLLKDPIAVFSAEWLADTFSVRPVLLVRHPAAFAASIKRLRLRHPFGHFLAQPLMMRDWLSPYTAELERFAAREQEIVDQAILLWNVIHHAIAAYGTRHPEWPLMRLEDISGAPSSSSTPSSTRSESRATPGSTP